jgi:hypothetical protein
LTILVVNYSVINNKKGDNESCPPFLMLLKYLDDMPL